MKVHGCKFEVIRYDSEEMNREVARRVFVVQSISAAGVGLVPDSGFWSDSDLRFFGADPSKYGADLFSSDRSFQWTIDFTSAEYFGRYILLPRPGFVWS